MTDTTTLPLETTALSLFTIVGLLKDENNIPVHLQLFIEQSEAVLQKVRVMIAEGELSVERGPEFQQLLIDICAHVMCHPIVASNNYLDRFAEGITESQAQHECRQFSVFALQFDVAQAKLVANAPTEEAYTERLQVLLNEKGIPFADGFEGELTGHWTNGTVHFNWMLNMAKGLGMGFEDIGKIWIGQAGTKAFVDATYQLYGSIDPNIASGAAFAIENWAANNLWKPWIAGMEKLNIEREKTGTEKNVNLGYLKYHELEETHHSQATLDELLENFTEDWFNREVFLDGAKQMLTEGVQAYYDSQLENLPEKDNSWPSSATEPRSFNPEQLPCICG